MKKSIFTLIITSILLSPLSAFAYGGGGGGGGGAFRSAPEATSNTATSSLTSILSSTADVEKTYSRPMLIRTSLININLDTRSARLTDESGSITIKPNKESTISAEIPPNTTVQGTSEWDGKIDPPILRSNALINKTGEPISGSSGKLERDNVLTVVKAGSTKSALNFSNNITLKVPIEDAEDGVSVNIYSSPDSKEWTFLTAGTVSGGQVVFETGHLSYFAIEKQAASTQHFLAPKDLADIKFIDTANHWAETYIKEVASKGIASGKSALKFAPDDRITRAELTKMAINAFGFEVPETVSSKPFIDVEANAWYAPYIQAAKVKGVVQGYGSSFKPNSPINRAEATKVLLGAAGFAIENQTSSSFSDTVSGAWYMKYLNFAKNRGILSGYSDGTFRPGNSITRAEVSKIIVKILQQ